MNIRRPILQSIVIATWLVACRRPPPQGVYPCRQATVEQDCPALWFCRADYTCWVTPDPDASMPSADASADAGSDAGCVPTTPSAEVCDGLDNDCDGTIDGAAAALSCGTASCQNGHCIPRHEWSMAAGAFLTSVPSETPTAVAFDGAGNVYVAGALSQPADFGGGLLTPSSSDVFVVSFGPNGVHRWSHLFGGAGYDGARSMAVSGDRLVLDWTVQGHVVVGGTDYTFPSTGPVDLLVELDTATGSVAWSTSLDGTGFGRVGGDDAGNAYVVTTSADVVDLGRGPIGVAGRPNYVFAALRRDGSVLWTRAAGQPPAETLGFAYDPQSFQWMGTPSVTSGQVSFALTATMDADDFGAGAPIGTGPVVVVTYDARSGGFVSGHRFGHGAGTFVESQAQLGGDIFIAGFQDANDVVPSANPAAFVARIDGSAISGAAFPDLDVRSLSASASGLCAAIHTNGVFSVGGGSITANSYALVGLDSAATVVWARQLQTSAYAHGLPFVAASATRAVVAHEMQHRGFDFGGGLRDGRVGVASYALN